MESVKIALIGRIREAMPQLGIDEDYGQLETERSLSPLQFPCVLIGLGETLWQSMGNGARMQQGAIAVVVKLAVDCRAQAEAGATPESGIAAREQLAGALSGAVQGMSLPGLPGALERRRTREYACGGGIKVYEQTFECIVRTGQ